MSKTATGSNGLIRAAFDKYLCLSILITLSATLGMMIDNVIAGNLLGSGAVAAIGMSLSVFMLFSGCAGIIETGAVALSARALGNRDAHHVNVLFSVSILAVIVIGVLLSLSCTSFAESIANFLGARDGQLHADTTAYLSGICVGAFAILLLQLLMGFTRLDNAPQLGIFAIVAMSISDVALNLFAVCVLNMGLLGMGLATTIAYCIAVGICCTHFVSKKNTLRLVNPLAHLGELPGILKTGLPDSLIRITVMLRTFVFNHMLLVVASGDAVAVLSMLSSLNTFTSSIATGIGQTATLMCGIFFGEQDRDALKSTLRTAAKTGFALALIMATLIFAFAPSVVRIFGLTGESLAIGIVAIRYFVLREPASIINQLFTSYNQGTGNLRAASAIAVSQSGLVGVLFAICTVWSMGPTSIWLSFVVGEVVTLLAQVLIANLLWARKRQGAEATLLDKMMYLPDDFQADWIASKLFHCAPSMNDVIDCSKQVSAWCSQQNIDERRVYLASLGVEEMAGNVVQHGFEKTKHPAIDLRVTLLRNGALLLHMRDNGANFNPVKFDLRNTKPEEAMGIRMLQEAIKNVEYQNTVGLNSTTVTLFQPKSQTNF